MLHCRRCRSVTLVCCVCLLVACTGSHATVPTPTVGSLALPTLAPTSAPARSTAPRDTPQSSTLPATVPGHGMIDLSRTQSPVIHLAAAPPGDGPPPDLTDVSFISAQEGFGVTFGGGIYRTGDAGVSWVRLFQRDGTRIIQVQFSDAANGMALGRDGCLPGPNCTGATVVVRTGDGGATWQVIQPATPTPQIADALPWLQVVAVSAAVSYAVRDPDQNGAPIAGLDGGMIATDDGGAHWHAVPLPQGFTISGGLSFLSPLRGYVTGWRGDTNAAQILATDDGGQSWRVLYADPAFSLRAVQFLDPQHGFAGGGWGGKPGEGAPPPEVLVATDDGGATWRTVYRRDNVRGGQPITRLRFVSPTTGWSALGGCNSLGENGPCGGTLRFTTDGGRTWRPDPSWGERANVVRFSSVGAAAWVVRGDLPHLSAPSVLDRTTDGGASWQTLWHPAALTVDRVQFVSPQVGWIDTNAGVFQTMDGGAHWMPYIFGAPVVMADRPVFASPAVVLAFHGHDALLNPARDPYRDLLRSDDGGRTWQPVPLVLPAHVDPGGAPTLAFAGPDDGWLTLVTDCRSSPCPSAVFATTDGGRSWQARVPAVFAGSPLSFGDDRHGAAVGKGMASDYLLLTADGGGTWAQQPLPPGVRVGSTAPGGDPPSAPSVVGAGGGPSGSIWFAGMLPQGGEGALFHSDDAGQHWAVSRLGRLSPGQIRFVTPLDGWLIASASGQAGALLVTHDGGQSWQQVWPVIIA